MDNVVLCGTGSDEPKGILHADNVNEIATVGATFSYLTLLSAIQKIEAANGTPSSYIVSPARKNTLASAKDLQNRWMDPPMDVRKLTQYVTSGCPDANVFAGDFTTVLIGMRQDSQIEVTTQGGDAFKNHEVWLKVTARYDVAFAHPGHLCRMIGITG